MVCYAQYVKGNMQCVAQYEGPGRERTGAADRQERSLESCRIAGRFKLLEETEQTEKARATKNVLDRFLDAISILNGSRAGDAATRDGEVAGPGVAETGLRRGSPSLRRAVAALRGREMAWYQGT
jgi:hypothetical protein